ncbi:MAG TPA: enoyl-CoA hydratase/isomerase family protein [Dehalococcoidia bacterium]|jgi:enoyl-CoA hydratase|nr:enoyl-CoA hydratase/isomerase family protein [Dehalococcoidia bacterium]
MELPGIEFTHKNGIAYITLNRPRKLNALNNSLLRSLRQVLDTIEADDRIRVAIITGAGNAFSAGFDLNIGSKETQDMTADEWRPIVQGYVNTFMKIWNLSKPVIAAVNGYALAGACELVQICDIKIASEKAVLGEPEIRSGIGPPLLITPFSVNLAKAKELLLTGDMVGAYEAEKIGLVGTVVPHEDLMEHCERIAVKICKLPQIGVKMSKLAVNRALEGMGFLNTIQANIELMTHFTTTMTPEQEQYNKIRREEGLKAALNWRKERYQD